jgi:hypothetical protein
MGRSTFSATGGLIARGSHDADGHLVGNDVLGLERNLRPLRRVAPSSLPKAPTSARTNEEAHRGDTRRRGGSILLRWE